MHQVGIVVLDGVLDSALSITLDVLNTANRIAQAAGGEPVFSMRVLGPRRGVVRCGSGYTRAVDGTLSSRAHCDLVVLPGIDAPLPVELDAVLASDQAASAMRYVQRAHARGALVAASCTSTFLLARAGLLDGSSATTSWYLAPHFRRCFPAVALQEDAMVVRSGRVVSAGAALSHVDLMLWLVRHVAGPSLGDRCARFLVIDDRPSQARYVALEYLGTRSDEVRHVERFLRKNLDRPIALAEIARAARTSPRTIARRFEETLGVSPLRFLRKLRVERAQHLLETTRRSVDEIAACVGYADPVALRRLLQKELGRNAREIRSVHARGRTSRGSFRTRGHARNEGNRPRCGAERTGPVRDRLRRRLTPRDRATDSRRRAQSTRAAAARGRPPACGVAAPCRRAGNACSPCAPAPTRASRSGGA